MHILRVPSSARHLIVNSVTLMILLRSFLHLPRLFRRLIAVVVPLAVVAASTVELVDEYDLFVLSRYFYFVVHCFLIVRAQLHNCHFIYEVNEGCCDHLKIKNKTAVNFQTNIDYENINISNKYYFWTCIFFKIIFLRIAISITGSFISRGEFMFEKRANSISMEHMHNEFYLFMTKFIIIFLLGFKHIVKTLSSIL